jgi:hypothetical protein
MAENLPNELEKEKKRIPTRVEVGTKLCLEAGSFDIHSFCSGLDYAHSLPFRSTYNSLERYVPVLDYDNREDIRELGLRKDILREIRRSNKFDVAGSEAFDITRNHIHQCRTARRIKALECISKDVKYRNWWMLKRLAEAGTDINRD